MFLKVSMPFKQESKLSPYLSYHILVNITKTGDAYLAFIFHTGITAQQVYMRGC
jgi:hypothetical protein